MLSEIRKRDALTQSEWTQKFQDPAERDRHELLALVDEIRNLLRRDIFVLINEEWFVNGRGFTKIEIPERHEKKLAALLKRLEE